uniref:Uncharacterized protein n=1 Tax=Rhizophora mucronata TaxID=61149 RepID=A0A2P2PPU1_RHIMU
MKHWHSNCSHRTWLTRLSTGCRSKGRVGPKNVHPIACFNPDNIRITNWYSTIILV